MSRFDEIKIGEKAEIIHVITDRDIEHFVNLTGDDNKIHIDKEYAGKTAFKKPVAHGMLSAAFISTIIGTKIPGDGALWYSQSIEFLMPVRVGDTITVTAEVIAKHDRLNAIELQTDIHNQDKQKVISGKAKVKIIEQETPEEAVVTEETAAQKVALVIGATGGIGAATCQQLAQQGYHIAVHYNSNEKKAAELVQTIEAGNQRAIALQADITNEAEVKELAEKTERRLGPITLLVNCATVKIPNIKFDNLDWADVEKHLNINLKANFYLAQTLVPGMKERKNGKLVFIVSQVVEGTPPTEWMPYVTSKYALSGFAKALAVELASSKINVNLVSPGMTETDLLADVPEKARMLMAAKTPMKRLATAKDIAGVIGFLASDAANYMTGETIRVNGGQVML